MKDKSKPNNDPFRGSNNPVMSESALLEMRHLREQRKLMMGAFDEEVWRKRVKSIEHLKRTVFTLTKDDYENLFEGKVRYLKNCYEIEVNGSTKIALKIFIWKLFHSYQECPYKQPHCFQHFVFTTCVSGGEYDLPA